MAVSKRKATHFCDSDGKKVESYLPNPIALGQYINHDTHGIDCYGSFTNSKTNTLRSYFLYFRS